MRFLNCLLISGAVAQTAPPVPPPPPPIADPPAPPPPPPQQEAPAPPPPPPQPEVVQPPPAPPQQSVPATPQSAPPTPVVDIQFTPADRKTVTSWGAGQNQKEYKDGLQFMSACQSCNAAGITAYTGPDWGFNIEREFGIVDERHSKCIHYVARTFSKRVRKNLGGADQCEASLLAIKNAGGNIDAQANDAASSNAMAVALMESKPILTLADALIKNGAKDAPVVKSRYPIGPASRLCARVYVPVHPEYLDPLTKQQEAADAKLGCDWALKNNMIPTHEYDLWRSRTKNLPVAKAMRKLLGLPAIEQDMKMDAKMEL